MTTDVAYPKREPFFSHRFTRLLAKCCVANEIGPIATWMLTVIVQTEDAAHYRRGVSFYDGQLMPLLGINSKNTMYQIRKKAIDAGWLHFEPGHKGKASTYWVTIPEHSNGIDDLPTDEGFDLDTVKDSVLKNEPNRERIDNRKWNESATESGTNPQPNVGHYIPIPNPNPVPSKTKIEIHSTEEKSTLTSEAAELAQLFHFHCPGVSKPMLADLTAEFQAKLDWLKEQGRNETEYIRRCVLNPKRDRTAARTIGTMWRFWRFCGLDGDTSQEKPYTPPKKTPEQIKFEKDHKEALKQKQEKEDARLNKAAV